MSNILTIKRLKQILKSLDSHDDNTEVVVLMPRDEHHLDTTRGEGLTFNVRGAGTLDTEHETLFFISISTIKISLQSIAKHQTGAYNQ